MNKTQNAFKYLIFALFLYLFFLIVKPFLTSIIFAIFFAAIFYPLFRYFHVRWKLYKGVSSAIVLVLTVIFILTPLVAFFGLVAKEAIKFIQTFDQEAFMVGLEKYSHFNLLGYEFDLDNFKDQIQSVLQTAANWMYGMAKTLGSSLANFTFSFLVFLFLYFYFLKDGKELVEKAKSLLPFEKKQNNVLLSDFHKIAKTVFVANLTSALVCGVIAFIGFTVFGLQGALIWALLAGILSLIPSIGSFIAYILATAVVFFFSGWPMALGLGIYYLVMEIGLIENLIKPKLLDDKIPVHPVLVFFSLVGGVHVFGSVGILYGPLIIVLFLSIFDFIVTTKDTANAK